MVCMSICLLRAVWEASHGSSSSIEFDKHSKHAFPSVFYKQGNIPLLEYAATTM
jgi:hypothetical protein